MNAVFDGACLGDGPITGVARSFLNALAAYGAGTLLLPRGAPDPRIAGVTIVEAPRGALRRQLGLPRLLRGLRASLLHSPVAAVPLRAPCPTIATLHDVPWLHRESGERSSPWRRFATNTSLRAAAIVVAPSRFTFADAVRLLGSDTKVRLVPHGIVLPTGSTTPASARTGPLIALGDDRPRKNRERLAAAHARAAARCPALPPLRFVGPPHDFVDEAAKHELLRTCRAVVQVSTFEGFGMPVLEALAHGAPLVCSDLPPFREIAGDATVFVDPFDVDSIADGLLRIVAASADTAEPARRERAARFTAERTADAWRTMHRCLVPR